MEFLDAVSTIPVFLLLRFEKKQLEYRREHVDGTGETHDDAERRLSEVDSLLETRSPSLVKSVECSERNDSVSFGVITKRGIEKRKEKLLEKIRQRRTGMTGQQTYSCTDKAVERNNLDDTCTSNGRNERVESPICCVVEDAPLEATAIDDNAETRAGTVRRTRSRRRKSVVSKMNEAIRRRRGR